MDGGTFSWSAWIPLLTCSVEMGRLRCPDFPRDHSNCVYNGGGSCSRSKEPPPSSSRLHSKASLTFVGMMFVFLKGHVSTFILSGSFWRLRDFSGLLSPSAWVKMLHLISISWSCLSQHLLVYNKHLKLQRHFASSCCPEDLVCCRSFTQ